MKDIELLAPVGSFEALKAAVQNGANAVYLGGKDFSARASANNFDRDELKEAVKYAHIRDVQVFVTANTLIKQDEIESFVEYAKFLYDIDVDAIILQDIGVAKLIKRLLPDFELHASTQMVAHSLEDVKYLENSGFDRVVLARELNVEEIKYICNNTKVDIEVFVHGALCVCYSGQCLMSSMIGNRSGNRGRCAQPCRQKYELIDIHSGEVINSDGDYLLSPRDLSTIEEIDKVVDAGIHSLKIEGRMKRPEYVATVISSYRKTVDNYLEKRKINVSDETISDLYTIFNRKFTKGLILGEIGKE
ncbi:MAG: peptidase U32 family protein, partial [Peptostreptococcaceae bacterium]